MKHFEPKVKNKSSFSILLLRDDSGVVRFRLKPFWVKFFIVLFALFSVSSGVAGYAAHYYWKKYNTLQRRQSILDTQLGENRRKLDEFAGIERAEAVLPRSSMSSVSVAAANGNGVRQNGANGEGSGLPEQAASSQTQQTAPQSASHTAQSPGSQTPNTSAPPTDAQPPPSNSTAPPSAAVTGNGQNPAQASLAGEQPVSQAPTESPEENEHPALIEEVQIRQSGDRRYNLSFGLSNRDKQIRLNGRVHVRVADNNGKQYEVSQINRDTLRFVINNYKKVTTSFSLPPEIDAGNTLRLHLTITAEDVPDITYSFTMPASSPSAPREEIVPEPGSDTASVSRG